MRVDSVVRNERQSIQQIIHALENGLTAEDNFSPELQATLTSIVSRLNAIETALAVEGIDI